MFVCVCISVCVCVCMCVQPDDLLREHALKGDLEEVKCVPKLSVASPSAAQPLLTLRAAGRPWRTGRTSCTRTRAVTARCRCGAPNLRSLPSAACARVQRLAHRAVHRCLQNAAVKGHADVVDYLLGRYVDFARANGGTREDVVELIDRADSRGRTALWDACRFGHVEVVRSLLGAGADPTLQNDEGLDALTISKSVRR